MDKVRQITLQSPALEQDQFQFLSRNVGTHDRFPRDFSKWIGGIQRIECGNKNTNQPKSWLVLRNPSSKY
jgi:hypothetical protein